MVAASHQSDESPEEAIDRFCREATSADNEIVVRDVKARFDLWLAAHPQALRDRRTNVASSMVDSFINRRRPKIGAAQLGLFRPEAIVPIGGGRRAWMEELSLDQFTRWESIETDANKQTNASFAGKTDYWASRRDVWGTTPTLGRLERDRFGYIDLPQDDYGYDGDDESDE